MKPESHKNESKLFDKDGNYDWNAFSDRLGKELKQDCITTLLLMLFLGILFGLFFWFNFT